MALFHHMGWLRHPGIIKVLNVSETGYYRFVKNFGKPGKDAILSAAMQEVLDESPFNDNYGVKRMQIALVNRGIHAGKRRITRIMREHGWLHEPSAKTKGSDQCSDRDSGEREPDQTGLPF